MSPSPEVHESTRRQVQGAVTRRLRTLRRVVTRASVVTIDGVRVPLDEPWIGPTLRRALMHEAYEAQELRVLRATIAPTDTYFEIGCGIGVVTATACHLLGDADRVHAYDANPAMRPAAETTCRANSYTPTIRTALFAEDVQGQLGTETFWVRPNAWSSSLTAGEDAVAVEVERLLLADAIAATGATYLMLDVEGAETALLTQRLGPSVRAVCVEVHPWIVSRTELMKMLAAMLAEGFALDMDKSLPEVWFFVR